MSISEQRGAVEILLSSTCYVPESRIPPGLMLITVGCVRVPNMPDDRNTTVNIYGRSSTHRAAGAQPGYRRHFAARDGSSPTQTPPQSTGLQ